MPFVTNEIMSRIEDPKAKGALARLELGDDAETEAKRFAGAQPGFELMRGRMVPAPILREPGRNTHFSSSTAPDSLLGEGILLISGAGRFRGVQRRCTRARGDHEFPCLAGCRRTRSRTSL